MIDHFCIMTYGGVVLFDWSSPGVSSERGGRHQIDKLISEILIEDRSNAQREHTINESKLKWQFSVETQLVYVVVYQRFLQFVHIDKFVENIRSAFEIHSKKLCPQASKKSNVKNGNATAFYTNSNVDFYSVFGKEFVELMSEFDAAEQVSSGGNKNIVNSNTNNNNNNNVEEDDNNVDEEEDDNVDSSAATPTSPSENTNNKKPVGGKRIPHPKGGRGRGGRNTHTQNTETSPTKTTTKKTKEARNWGKDGTTALTASQVEKIAQDKADLVAASSGSSAEQIDVAAARAREKYIKIDAKTGREAKIEEKDWSDQMQERGQFSSWFRGVWGNCKLDMQDLDKIIPHLREKLVSKNVAVDVAERICTSLSTTLTGRQIGTLESMESVVEQALIEALRRILRPKQEINILREIEVAKARHQPYTIVFCGVNGVGKSTSLSKIAFWLQQNGYSILIAAGDTFRHGAVEQLEVHGRCLNVPIFQMGYNTDPTIVTRNAMQFAQKNRIDVVLVDTAGRMQDHESRMAALARLIGENNPNLVLFVGEALVGNNGIDQLKKFNQCLRDYGTLGTNARGIDGIILTKFDTIDDKVGAAVSMVYQLGQPIVFVGVGQTYQDLKTIEPDVVVESLMK